MAEPNRSVPADLPAWVMDVWEKAHPGACYPGREAVRGWWNRSFRDKLCVCGMTASIAIDNTHHFCGTHAVEYYNRIDRGEDPETAMIAAIRAATPK